jgi:MbtH protein
MTVNVEQDKRTYRVIVNQEGQYSLWLASNPIPRGWSEAGRTGTKAECLEFVKEVWTDMRPLSLRTKMANAVEQ